MHAYNAEEVCAHLRGCWKKRIRWTGARVDLGSGRAGVEVKEEPVEIARGGRRGDLCV